MLLREVRSNSQKQLSLQQKNFTELKVELLAEQKVELLAEHETTEELQMQLIERLKGGLVDSVGKKKRLEVSNEEKDERIKLLEERLRVNGIEV